MNINKEIDLKSTKLSCSGYYLYQLNVLANQEFSSQKPKQVFLISSKTPLSAKDMISLSVELTDEDIENNVSKYRNYSILKSTCHLNKPYTVLEIMSKKKIIVESDMEKRIVEINLPVAAEKSEK